MYELFVGDKCLILYNNIDASWGAQFFSGPKFPGEAFFYHFRGAIDIIHIFILMPEFYPNKDIYPCLYTPSVPTNCFGCHIAHTHIIRGTTRGPGRNSWGSGFSPLETGPASEIIILNRNEND